jgi:antitoxin MazE
MLAVIQKWGNSLGLQFPPEIILKAQLSQGEEVSVTMQKEQIIIKPLALGLDKKYSLEELVAKMPSDYKPHEENWGPPVQCH